MPNDLSHSDHLSHPLLVALVLQTLLQGDGFRGDFVPFAGELLDHVVVAVFVRDEEGSFDVAPVGVLVLLVEDLFVVFVVVEIDGAVEGEENHLGSLGKDGQKTNR